MLLTIIIVCVVFGFICQPIQRLIEKKVTTKWLRVLVEIVVYWVIFMALYAIAELFGLEL